MIHKGKYHRVDLPFGPGQPTLRVHLDDDGLRLSIGWGEADEWRQLDRRETLNLPREILGDLRHVLATMESDL